MSDSKYAKYFLTEPRVNVDLPEYRGKPTYTRESGITRVVDLTSKMLEGSEVTIGTTWMWPRKGPSQSKGVGAHTHDFIEILGFFGTNPEDEHDLGGEVELWLEDEQFIMTKSFMTYVPAGMKHCPLVMRRIDRPIFHFGVVPRGQEYI